MRRRPPGAGSSPTTRSEASRSRRPTPTRSTSGWPSCWATPPDVALLAVGAYGRRELCPASDLDLVLVHDGKRGRDLGEIADAVWYPIWDSGVALDHSVRTPKEARAVADRDLKTALGLLDGRVVAGDAVLGRAVAHPHPRRLARPGPQPPTRLRGPGRATPPVVRRRRLRARARPQGGTGRQPRRRRPARPRRASPTCTGPTSGWPPRSTRCSTCASRCNAWPAGPTGCCSSTRTTSPPRSGSTMPTS